jgi:hypothetical protein
MAVINPPIALQNAGNTHTAEMLRAALGINMSGARAAASLTPRGGVHPFLGGQLAVTQQGSPTTGVQVAAGVCFVPGTENTKQGGYIVMNDAALNVGMTAAPGSNSRIDTIVVRIQDQAYSGASNTATIESVTGTAAASPSAPALPNNAIPLADVLIPSGDTAYTDSQITDRRPYVATGVILCRNSADRPSPAAAGMTIYQLDTQTMYTHNGTAWEVPGQAGTWTTFPFAAGYVDAVGATGAAPASYRVIGNKVQLRGSVRNSGSTNLAGSNLTIGTMPVGARPVGTYMSLGVAQWGSTLPIVRREVTVTSGTVIINCPYSSTWISLDGMEYYTS